MAADGKQADQAEPGQHVDVIFDQTPFYAEMGGQVADTGQVIDNYGKVVATVKDVQHAPHQQNLHTLELTAPIKKGARYKLVVDRARHLKIEKNHTATHLLDQALRNVLGGHTQQAGSLVEAHYLRFDFNHFGQVTKEDLKKVEDMVNEQIWKEIPVTTVETDIDSAKKMGAIASSPTSTVTRYASLRLVISTPNSVVGTTSKTPTKSASSRLFPKVGSAPGSGGSKP